MMRYDNLGGYKYKYKYKVQTQNTKTNIWAIVIHIVMRYFYNDNDNGSVWITMLMMMTTMTNSMECVSLMTEVRLPQALPSDPIPGILHFYHDDDYNHPQPRIFHFDDDDDYYTHYQGRGCRMIMRMFRNNFWEHPK